MNPVESIRMALSSLRANKLRTGLTMLGIIIGTGAVIALLAVGQGAQAEITGQIQSIGSNLIFVFSGRMQQSGSRVTMRAVTPLTRQDADAIADTERNPHVAAVAPEIDRNVTITYGGGSVSVSVVGTTPEYQMVRNFRTQYGEFLSSADETAAARVVVLGGTTATDLFGASEDAVGETVRINRVPFRVIGVLEEKGGQGFGGGSRDAVAIVPLSTAQKKLFSGRLLTDAGQRVDIINVSAVDEASMDTAIDEITWTLRDRHDIQFEEDDFTVASQQDILSVAGQITSILTIVLGAIAGISLLVGGIGIMNIMLVSVTERTREIGIRKAVGAKRSDILWQFLIESIVLSVVGGVVGIAFGSSVAALVQRLADLGTLVTAQAVALAVGFSLAVGLFFGIYPASRAANLNPIDALRYE
jgi:putative ABC transport system permease protein